MNNTTTNLSVIVAIFMAATLVVGIGTFAATTTQSTAYAYSKKDNGKGNDNGNTITIQKCKQVASESGFDNNQGLECENVICTHPGENATCLQEGTAAAQTPPVNRSTGCEQCFTTILTAQQITMLLGSASVAQACAILGLGQTTEVDFRASLDDRGIPSNTADALIACLLKAGVVFAEPEPG